LIIHNNGIIKLKPEDFIVIEKVIFSLNPQNTKGNIPLFILKKNNKSLFDTIFSISQILKVPINNILFFGEKDKLAQTKQLIYIKNAKNIQQQIQQEIKQKNFQLIYLFNIDDIQKVSMIGNNFTVNVRKIKDIDKVKERIEKIKSIGIPNYYDIQRFGNRLINHIIGYFLLNSKYYQATYLFLSFIGEKESLQVQKIRQQLRELFKNNTFYIDEAKKIKIPQSMNIEKLFLKILSEKLSLERTWKVFPKKFTSLLKDSYHSFLFNQKLKNLILKKTNKYTTKTIEINKIMENKLLNIFNQENKVLKSLSKIEFVYPLEELKIEELKTTENNQERPLFIKPIIKNYTFEDDEIFEGYKKLKIEFSLRKGSFATNIFNFILE